MYSIINDESNKIVGLVDNTTNPHDHHGISVKIGDEMSDRLLLDYSLVSATYNVGGHGRGMIAILGPTHMHDRKSTRLNSSHASTSYAVLCLTKKNTIVPN